MRECDVGVRRIDRKPIKMCNLKRDWLQQNAPQVGRVCLPNLAIFLFLNSQSYSKIFANNKSFSGGWKAWRLSPGFPDIWVSFVN